MPVKLNRGKRYYILFTDEATSYLQIYFLKIKDKVFRYFTELIKIAKRETNNKVLFYYSNNSDEFKNNRYAIYYQARGIIQTFSTSYNPEQNDITK